MPQATDELRAIIQSYFGKGLDDFAPSECLRKNGWVEVGNGLWQSPMPWEKLDRATKNCMQFLIDEWDHEYAGEIEMPRGKRAEKAVDAAIQEQAPIEPNFQTDSDEQLVQRFIALDDWVKSEKKRFDNFMEGHKQTLEVIRNEFLRRLNERKSDSTKTEHGTAYKTNILNVSVSAEEGAPYVRQVAGENGEMVPMESTGREALLDFALDNWDAIGSDLLMVDAQKDAVKRWLDEHEGVPPPGLKIGWFTKVNIRRA